MEMRIFGYMRIQRIETDERLDMPHTIDDDVNPVPCFVLSGGSSINKHSERMADDKDVIGEGCKWTLTQLQVTPHHNHSPKWY